MRWKLVANGFKARSAKRISLTQEGDMESDDSVLIAQTVASSITKLMEDLRVIDSLQITVFPEA